ncbi:mediator complex subunit MED14-domain-containing protein [Suillus paluster]|uniref:mediator complex subunit MED14-domain-containing protein n=1 Tax=Suillus paluster TaxID=48578 RepID=UPI001B87B6C7|nr:mediator complex subunit MED14-domain-containing protein [Suillus paluster]KAG1750599.1 mediator complex subunit MED14-domain-containing protein [Suillus paluster]
MEGLENELPLVLDGQVPLGDLLSRVAQAIYAELSELVETLPNMSDSARKRTLADWVVKTKKQVVKLYAITKWARDAETVQKCMNITAFLMNQNQQFEDVMRGLTYAKESLDPARLRNHDLLTSLDVLTTGTYQRLPSGIKKSIVPITPLTDPEIIRTLSDMENAIRYRLRMTETIPVEMLQHRIANGRVHFMVPKLFETAICLRGAEKNDGWFFVSVKFLITVGGDLTGMQEFPSEPTGVLRRHIADEADSRMACYLPLPDNPEFAPNPEDPPRPQLPEGTVDAPLVRLFNFLQMMSMSYQLEILCYQAQRMRSLGWADFLKVEMRDGRKTLAVSYWMRPPQPGVPASAPNRLKLPPHGGTLTISIIENVNKKTARSPMSRMLAELQRRSKLGDMRPSDDVESLQFDAKWEPLKGVLAANIDAEEAIAAVKELVVDSGNIDFESMLRKVIEVHTQAILKFYQVQLQRGPVRVFSPEGKVVLVSEIIQGGYHSLHVHLCADEIAIVTIDTRTGRLSIRDTGDLAAAGRGPRFSAISDKLNEAPNMLFDVLIRLRFNTISDIVEQKANYLGFQVFRHRNFSKEEIQKLGAAARGMMYIQLANFPTHYLVLVLTDEEFRYALISTKMLSDTMFGNMIMEDIGWLDVRRIRGDRGAGMDEVVVSSLSHEGLMGQRRRREDIPPEFSRIFVANREHSFNLETQVLRELYAYCCARVAYTRVERQFKLRGIPYTHVNPTITLPQIPELGHIQSSLARSVPALCVQSSDILSGAPAAEAAMPNIRVIPLNWWSDKKAQVVTCVKLKYVQQPVGKRAAAGSSSKNIIRPSKRIIYDAAEAVVSFLSEEVDTCVDEFLEEWARVSKMVVIAREVARMAKEKKWRDVRLLSFDLQTVEFAYASDYTVLITCTDQLSPTGGSFELRFSRCTPSPTHPQPSSLAPPQLGFPNHHLRTNPHEQAEPYLRHVLRHGPLSSSLDRLVELLRNTLPIAVELEHINASARDLKQSPGRGRGRPRIAGKTAPSEPWVDTYVKGLGWWRVLYGDLRHALDFRLMTGQRIAILDASYSLFGTSSPDASASSSSPSSELLSLLPIPDFKTLVLDAIKSVRVNDEHARAACIDVGVVCDSSVLSAVARALHERVLKKLRGR